MSAPELSPVPREARPYQGATAGVVTRAVANTIDALVVGVIVGGCYLGLVAVKFLLDPRTFMWPDGHKLLGLTFTLALAVVYLWLSWWLLGRSYGKHIMGIFLQYAPYTLKEGTWDGLRERYGRNTFGQSRSGRSGQYSRSRSAACRGSSGRTASRPGACFHCRDRCGWNRLLFYVP